MSFFRCPNCQASIPIQHATEDTRLIAFHTNYDLRAEIHPSLSAFKLIVRRCCECNFESITVEGISGAFADLQCHVYPKSSAKKFPEYVPAAIRNDYEEACAVLELSPKASATLSRRCLQGIIRDFFGVVESTLYAEIDRIKDRVSMPLWNAIDALRKIGNIGAHMNMDVNVIVDIEIDEAKKLVMLIERMIEATYIQHHHDESLLSDVVAIKDKKESEKNAGRPSPAN